MKNKFDIIYSAATVITAFAVVILLSLFTTAKPFAATISFIATHSEILSATAPEHKNQVQPQSSTQQADRTVFAVNPLDTLTQTPPDILGLISEEKKQADSDVKDGKITEKQYSSSTVTKKIGNILVRNNTTTQQKLNLQEHLDASPQISVTDKTQPSVLIFHTHTTESYEILDRGWYAQDYVTRSKSADRNMVRVGMEIKEQLENAGYTVIHDTQIHDESYTGAYSHSRKSVEEYLKKYPSIQIVLDIHRDAIELDNGERIKPVATVFGKKAAQMMIITGCEEGKVTNFPNWKKNLTFAMELQSICEELYPGVMRPLYFCQRKYNMDLSPNNLLVEMGSCANTLEEAAYSGRLLGNALVKLLDKNSDKG